MSRDDWKTVGSIATALVLVGCSDSEPSTEGAVHRMGTVDLVDFSSGVVATNHPEGAGAYGTWYDATNDTFGTPSAASLEGEPALRVDDGGFTNGVYAILPGVVPTAGEYVVRARVHVVENEGTGTNGVRAFQMGVSVGDEAAHRGLNPSDLPATEVAGDYVGLTEADDTGEGPQWVETTPFTASAGDDVLLAFGTDVQSGDWSANAGAWSGSYVLVGAPQLVPLGGDDGVVDNDDGAPAYTEVGPWATSAGVGYDGGTYRFSSTTNGSTASWTATLEPGFYEVDTTYRAGGNRSPGAFYTVSLDGEQLLQKSIDQRFQDLSWVALGLIEVPEGGDVTVTLDGSQSDGEGAVVVADAVRFVPTDGPPPIDPPEVRLAAITVFDPIDDVGAIQSTIDELAELHYNAVAVHTRYRGDATYFPNKVDSTYPNHEPRSPEAGDVDVLEEFVTRGHDAGLQVYAYVNTHLVTDGADGSPEPTHVVNVRPELRTWAYNGGSPTVQTTAEDPEGLWLDPALQGTRTLVADIAGDIAINYDVDGLILDRIRYPQTAFTRTNRDFGYHPDAVAEFNDEYDKSGVPDPYDLDWIEFRQLAVQSNVEAIYDRLEDIDDQLVLLAYPIGRFSDAVNFNYQDWPQWLRERAIDGVLPQIYTDDEATFATRLDEQLGSYGGDRLIGVTTLAFNPGVPVAAQLESARALGADGASPFRHGVMGSLGYLDELEVAWDGIAEFPELPWKGQPISSLGFKSACSPEPFEERRWKIHNSNAWAIEATYWLLGTSEHGTLFASPGDTFVVTEAKRGLNIAVLSWRDEDEKLRARLQLSLGWWSC